MKKNNTPVKKGKKVLVIDDNSDMTALLKKTLEKSGQFVVKTVNDAMQAIDVAREFKPDLMLLDIIMPDMDGYEIVEKIKYDKDFISTKIIFFSGLFKQSETGKTGKKIGRHMCLAKSAKVNNVARCINNSFREAVAVN